MEYTQKDIEDNLGLVFMTAKNMKHLSAGGVFEFQDLVSEGTLGLIHALEKFDPSQGCQFSTYAVKCIWGYMLRGHKNFFRAQWQARQSKFDVSTFTISMHTFDDNHEPREVVGMDDGGESERQTIEGVSRTLFWDTLLPEFTPRQRQIVELILEGKEQPEIARALGISCHCVSQTRVNAIRLARKVTKRREKQAHSLLKESNTSHP